MNTVASTINATAAAGFCGREGGAVLIRNPFHAVLGGSRHKAAFQSGNGVVDLSHDDVYDRHTIATPTLIT
jgi:hypothetical protein